MMDSGLLTASGFNVRLVHLTCCFPNKDTPISMLRSSSIWKKFLSFWDRDDMYTGQEFLWQPVHL